MKSLFCPLLSVIFIVLMQDATRGSHVVILLADRMREITEEDHAPPMVGGSMFPPTLIGSTGNVPCQLVVVAIGEHNYKPIVKSLITPMETVILGS